MLLTLALVVFLGAIFISFSQEFISLIKKIFEIKGAKLVLPLAIGSWLVYHFDYWILWIVYYYREVVSGLVYYLSYFFPFKDFVSGIFLIILLTGVSVAPVFILETYLWKKHFKHYPYPYVTSTIIWAVTALLFIMASM
jgi:hypothetical protein